MKKYKYKIVYDRLYYHLYNETKRRFHELKTELRKEGTRLTWKHLFNSFLLRIGEIENLKKIADEKNTFVSVIVNQAIMELMDKMVK